MRKILVVTHFLPWPVRQGSSHRSMELLVHLRRQGHRVDLFVAPTRPWARSLVQSFPPVVERVIMSPPTGPEGRRARLVGHAANVIRAMRIPAIEKLGRRTLQTARHLRGAGRAPQPRQTAQTAAAGNGSRREPPGLPFTEGQKAEARTLLAEGNYDTVLVGYTFVARLLHGAARDGRLWIVDTIDCFHQRAESMRQQGIHVPGPLDFTRQQEMETLADFDVIVAIQEEEARTFRAMLPDKKIVCVGMSSHLERLPGRRRHVTIVGAPSPVNAEGAVRVLEKVWPRVLRQYPDAVLDLYGGLCNCDGVEAAARRLNSSVVLHGVVDELKQAYHCDVVLAPVWAGSGLKTKVVEALGYGKPVVTTPTGAQGLAAAVGSAALVAQEPDQMADHLSSLLGDEARRRTMADAAYAFAAEHFAPRRVYAELDSVLLA